MPLTQLEKELRLIARECIAKGKLPGEIAPSQMWGGFGTGQRCDLCGKPVGPEEMEYEVAYAGQSLRFHLVCYSAWQLELARQDYLTKHR